ncbi:MAG: flagellar hook-basal body protein [Phycisphaerales bacterium]|nr:MAG: flagellar hook-basal body protein [Phycisphaerales bacterium]
MSYGLFLSAAGMQANEYRMSITANNLANADTVGFKHDLAVLAQRPIERILQRGGAATAHPVFDGMSGGTSVRPTYHSFSQGTLERTGRALDVAIEGEGFFAVQDGDAVRYTRDGRLTFNHAGELVLAAGGGKMQVLSDVGLPIQRLEEGGSNVQISDGGIVRQGDEVLGRIGLTAFDDPMKVRKTGHNLFDAGDAEAAAAKGRVIPGTVEHSTVDPISALTSMIEVQRAYEMNGRALTAHDRVTGEAVNTVGRI